MEIDQGAQELLRAPAAAGEKVAARDPRRAVACTPTYQRFVVRDKVFTQQFSHIYTKRLESQTGPVA